MASVYSINKGINKPVEFKGLKAQYIWYMGGMVIGLLVVFMILYSVGINQYLCILLVGACGLYLTLKLYRMSRKYGQHGLMKRMARKMVPHVVKCNHRDVFIKSKKR